MRISDWSSDVCSSDLDPAPAGAGYRTAIAAVGEVESTVTALGTLTPKNAVDVGAQVSGQLQVLHVEIGDVVAKGELLAEIDARVLTAKVDADRDRKSTRLHSSH